MSTWEDVTVACPACGAITTARVASSVHIGRVPEARERVLAGTFHREACSGCGRTLEIDRSVTYVDVERGHWIQLEPARRRDDWPAIEREVLHGLAHALDTTSPLVSDLAVSARRRLVFGVAELREKLVLWDAGLDDAVVECVKVRAFVQDPALARARLLVDRVADDGGLEIMKIDANDPPQRYAIPASWIEHAEDERTSLAARFPELFRGGYVNVLRLLAVVALLALAACWQSTAREQIAPPPAPPARTDAGAFVETDAGLVDAPPLDAPAPDAGPRAYNWDRMRLKPESYTATRTAARVMNVNVLDADRAQFEAVLDRGRLAGVEKGWKGILLDLHGYPKQLDIEVIAVSNKTCVVRTNANPDQLRGSGRVVLWNPDVTREP